MTTNNYILDIPTKAGIYKYREVGDKSVGNYVLIMIVGNKLNVYSSTDGISDIATFLNKFDTELEWAFIS